MIRVQKHGIINLIQRRSASDTTHVTIQRVNKVASAYEPLNVELSKYDSWEKRNLFKAENSSSKPRFSMILPPPNVTGKLHLGHALACTVQDVIARYKRSTGHNVLWLPGIDHAGIATQGIVEKHLKSQGVNRLDIGREEFVDEVWKWKEKHGNTIFNQLRTLGCSLDWSRQAFTMDPAHTRAVTKAFLNLYKQGYIYRKKALVNWCNALQSTVSDIEVDNIPISGPTDVNVPGYDSPVRFGQLYNLVYRIDDSNAEIVVSTTTPETMLGDTAIAVNPKDARYCGLQGKRVQHQFRNTTIPIIFDEYVDMEFGTGAIAVTAHSKIGYEIAKNHNIPILQVIDESGLMKNSEYFNNVKRFTCRQILIQKLYEMGLLKEVLPYQMILPICSLTGDLINYLPKEQCFLSCRQLNEKAAELVKAGHLKILPERYIQNWLDLSRNASDWCISRQLWWGHQIPMYKCSTEEKSIWVTAYDLDTAQIEAFVLLETLPDLIKIERDKDVLDPWFASSIYALSALGFPRRYQRRNVIDNFPLNLTVAGQDLLELWVRRMVILNLALMDKLPFNKVFVHGTVCDSDGAKICKQRGNMIDLDDVVYGVPFDAITYRYEEMQREGLLSKSELDKICNYCKVNFVNTDGIPRCGADALRFTLLSQDIKSDTVNFNIVSCYENKLFCNKIWQCVINAQQYYQKLKKTDDKITIRDLTYFDKWILSRLANMVLIANQSIASYDFHVAVKALRTFVDEEFCDIYMEGTKVDFENKDLKQAYAHAHTMSVALNTSLRILSPFMVHLTDELIPRVPGFRLNIIHNFKDTCNSVLSFPKYADFKVWKNAAIEKRVGQLLNAVKLVKNIKGLYNITSELVPCLYINTGENNLKSDILNNKDVILNLTKCTDVKFEEPPRDNIIKTMFDRNTEIAVALETEEARQILTVARYKLENKIKRLEVILSILESKYSSEEYLKTATVDAQLADRERLEAKKKKIEEMQKLL